MGTQVWWSGLGAVVIEKPLKIWLGIGVTHPRGSRPLYPPQRVEEKQRLVRRPFGSTRPAPDRRDTTQPLIPLGHSANPTLSAIHQPCAGVGS